MLRAFASKHALGVVGSQTGNRFARLARAFVVFKALDEHDANRFMWLTSAALVASVFSDFGLRNTVYAELGRLDDDERPEYLGKVFAWKLVASIAVLAAVPFYVRLSGDDSWGAAVLTALLSVYVYVADPGVQALRGAALGQLELLIFAIDSAIPLGFMVYFWFSGTGELETVLAVWALGGVARSALTWRLVRRRVMPFALCRSLRAVLRFAAERTAPGLVLLIFMFHLRFPILAAPFVGLEDEVGILALVVMIVQSFQLVPAIVSSIVIPAAFKTARTTSLAALTRPSVILNLAAGALGAVVLFLVSGPVLALGRAEFAADAALLQIASISLPFICANQMLRLLAIAAGVRAPLLVSMTSSVLVAAAAVVVLARLLGASGAVAGYVASEILLFVVLLVLVRRTVAP